MRPDDRYDSLFQFYGEKHSVDWLRLKAQTKQESRFDPNAVNPRTHAKGLSQFMERTWEEWRDGTVGIQPPPAVDLVLLDPRDPEDAINAQAAYMSWLLGLLRDDWELALAAYNWGIGNLHQLLLRHGADWKEHLPAETRGYIDAINNYYIEYRKES